MVSLRGRQKKLGAGDWMAGGLGRFKGNEKSFDLRRERLGQKITKTGDLLTKSSGIVHLSQDLQDLFSVRSMDEPFGGQA